MIIDNNGGNVFVGDDMPMDYDFTIHYTNSGRVEHRYFTWGQTAFAVLYGDPKLLKWRKQKKRTQAVAQQKVNYQKKYLLLLKEHLSLQRRHIGLLNNYIELLEKNRGNK